MIKYVAIQYDDSLGYREYMTEERFDVVKDAISFVEKQPESKCRSYHWVIEVEYK